MAKSNVDGWWYASHSNGNVDMCHFEFEYSPASGHISNKEFNRRVSQNYYSQIKRIGNGVYKAYDGEGGYEILTVV